MGNFKKFFKNVAKSTVNLIFPDNVTCDFCGGEMDIDSRYHSCSKCMASLPFNNKTTCIKCGSEIEEEYKYCYNCLDKKVYYKIARAPFVYKDNIITLIHNLKYHNAKYLAEPLGNYMTNTIIENNFDIDAIVAVPLQRKREKKRGYNQSLLLAKQIAKNLNLEILQDVIKRTKFTKSQTELSYDERYANLEDSFEIVDKTKLLGRKILLVDDVMTTGATCEACSKLLMQNGANVVYICCAARTTTKKEENEE